MQDQPLEEAPAAACYPNDALEERGGPSVGDFALGLGCAGALVGAIAGPVLTVVAGGETDAVVGAFFGGPAAGGTAGAILGGLIGQALWNIGTHEEEADIAPAKLTPSDNAALDRLTRTRKEEHGHAWVEVDLPSPAPVADVTCVLSTALLAREEAGEIRLEILGGKLIAKLIASPRWPGGSLEMGLCEGGPVYATIFKWIGSNSSTPTGDAMQRILASLVKRTLLDVERKRILGRFTMTSSHYLLPQRTASRLVERPDRLIEECRRTRPDVHAALTKDIERAFAERYEEPPPGD